MTFFYTRETCGMAVGNQVSGNGQMRQELTHKNLNFIYFCGHYLVPTFNVHFG